MSSSIIFLLLLGITLVSSEDVDYKQIAQKLISQFPLNKDVPLNVYIKGNVSDEDVKYNFNATDLILTGLSQFVFREAEGNPSGDKVNPNLHDLDFYAHLGRPSVKGVVKYIKTEPKPEDPEKSVSGAAASADADWTYHFIMTIDVSKKTVESSISVPTGNPHLAAWVSDCTAQPVAKVCPKIDKEISKKRWAIYQAITRKYIDKEFEKMSF